MNGRHVTLALATALMTALLLVACGHTGRRLPSLNLHPNSVSLSDALAQLDALPRPEGVKEAVWNELKGALKSALTTNSQKPITKLTSTPPTGDANYVTDFGITDHGDGSYSLSWHYRNLGDYDQNGTVGVSDITPLAQHFSETYDTKLETNTIQAIVDGSGNGKVGIEDVTQIAMYFGTSCTGYSLRTSDILPTFVEDTAELDVIPLSFAQGEGRYEFGVEHALPSHSYIAVAPVDAEGVFGVLSNIVQTQNHNPVAALSVDPQQGDAPLTVGLDAGDSTDVDGPIAKYEWDFEGDGVWDEDSGTLSYVEHVYETPDFYYPVVRVTDDEGATSTAEASVFAGQWRISTVVTGLLADPGPTSLVVIDGNPSVSFYGGIGSVSLHKYWFVRAGDSIGSAWNAPISIYYMIDVGCFCDCTLFLVNGKPAVGLLNGPSSRLYYTQAEDADGTSWGTPLEVCMASTGGNEISFAVVDGNPAAAFSRGQLCYVRALGADGTTWGTPIDIDIDSGEPSLAVVNGFPAITFGGEDGLCYVRAEDVEGNTWAEPTVIDSSGGAPSSLAVINGKPAVAYEGAIYTTDWTSLVKYAIADDENGLSWGNPLTLDENARLGYDKSLMAIHGRPAICYHGRSDDSLRYISAADADGRKWRAPIIISTDGVLPFSTCLNEVNGNPAISYLTITGCTELRFAIYY